MREYTVVKNYGHFTQYWSIMAESKEDAWNRAERDGTLNRQFMYGSATDTDSEGHVIDVEEQTKKHPPITEETYIEWLKEAVEKGMRAREEDYEKLYGLPFTDVG